MFRTEIAPQLPNIELNHQSRIVSIGSCFADSMGTVLLDNKFDVITNPFGVLYNPKSIFQLLHRILIDQISLEDSLVQVQSVWHSLLIHSKLSSTNQQGVIDQFKQNARLLKDQLISSQLVIITLGTAFAYYHKSKNLFVGNCHKIPGSAFAKVFLEPEVIVSDFELFYDALAKLNPNVKILFTVSPVRHLKDGLENNSLSKASLRLAIDRIAKEHPSVQYFPSYEIMMDDLRDYRYYKDDLLHPTPFAEKYIWEKLKNCLFDLNTISLLNEWEHVRKCLTHKPFNPDSDEHQKFLLVLKNKLIKLSDHINCSTELEQVKSQMR